MGGLREVERIRRVVPRFQGYQEKDSRIHSNQAFIDFLSDEVVRQIDRIAALEIELSGMGEARACAELDRGILRLQILLDAIGTLRLEKAMWLDLPRVEQDSAETLYRIDGRLLDAVDVVVERVDALERCFALKEPLARPIGDLVAVVDAVAVGLRNRREIITNLMETNIG